MRSRLLLATTAIGACAAALLAATVTAAPDRPVPTSASNKRAARLDAKLLLSRLQLPADGVSSPTEPSGDGGYLKALPLAATSARVEAYAWWEVPESPSVVLAYVSSHPPAGFTSHGSGGLSKGGKTIYRTLNFGWPPVRGVLGQRTLAITVMALSGGETGVFAEAESDWIVPRPRAEQVPSSVHEVDVASGPTIDLSVTSAAKVRRLVSIINGLPIVQPAVYSCPALIVKGARVITLSFRSAAGGRLLARATYVAYPHLAFDSGPCNAIDLTIAGRRQKPLLGGAFLRRVQRLLGVSLLR